MDNDKLQEIIDSHEKWLKGDGGERAVLHGANLSRVHLAYTSLCKADFYNANLSKAYLRGADLRDVNLRRATLCGANLHSANLCGADLSGADLCDVILSGANLHGTILPKCIIQVGPIGSRRSYTVYNVDDDIVQCGCWNNYRGGTLEEFKKRVDAEYPVGKYRLEYLAAISMFEKLKECKNSES